MSKEDIKVVLNKYIEKEAFPLPGVDKAMSTIGNVSGSILEHSVNTFSSFMTDKALGYLIALPFLTGLVSGGVYKWAARPTEELATTQKGLIDAEYKVLEENLKRKKELEVAKAKGLSNVPTGKTDRSLHI